MMFTIIILAALPRVFAFQKVLTEFHCALDGWQNVAHGRDGAKDSNDGKLFEKDCQKKCYDSNGWEGKRGRKMVCGYTYRDAADLDDWEKVIVDVKSTIDRNSCGDNSYESVAHWNAEGFRAIDSNGHKGSGEFYLCIRTRTLGELKDALKNGRNANAKYVTELIARTDEPDQFDYDFIGKWDNHDGRDAWAYAKTEDGMKEEKMTRFFIELYQKKAELKADAETDVFAQWKYITLTRKPSEMKQKISLSFSSSSKSDTEENQKKYWEKKVKRATKFEATIPYKKAKFSASYDYTNEEKNTRTNALKERSIETFEKDSSFEYEYTIPAQVDGEDIHMNWWYWSVRAENTAGEWATVENNPANAIERTGCGHHIAPNCLPGHCLDPQCWTCTETWAKIDPDFKYPEQCQGDGKGCQWIGIPSDQCPPSYERQNIPACTMDMKHGDRCQVFGDQLPNKENGDINNCGAYDVFEYTCDNIDPSKVIVNSGDTIYLKTHTGYHIEVEEENVQARWNDQGHWQGLIIEKADGGAVYSGDTVFFRTYKNRHIDVEGQYVRARYDDQGDWQEFVIEKSSGYGEMIYVGDTIYLRSHTGKYIDVEGTLVQARYEQKGDWQALTIETVSGTEESSLNVYSALNSSEDFVVYGLAFVGLITILVLLRSTFQKNDYKAIDEASKLKISGAEL